MTLQLCPTDQDLESWLNDKLGPVRRTEIGGHVNSCNECQASLEELTRIQAYGLDGLRRHPLQKSHQEMFETTDRATRRDETTDLTEPCPERSKGGERTESADLTLNLVPNSERTEPLEVVNDTSVDCTQADRDQTVVDCTQADRDETVVDGAQADRDQNVDRSPFDTEPDANGESPRVQSTIPSYELLEEIGSGGMGVVYKARQLGLNRLVALKMIRGRAQVRPDLLARIRIEAETVARLSHPNIVHIYEIGEVDGLPFLSLELLEGGTLANRLARDPQPGRSAAELIATLARAIQMAHDAKIIHRDLKPSNVIYSSDGIPKITDFGLAKRLESDSRQTETGQIMGTPCYMAPEQAMGHTRDVGPSADIYALGAILYEMLTGRQPFKGGTPIETVRQVIHDDAVPPRRLVPSVARDLETICLRALNKEPSKRYPSALALADDLERFLVGRPIKARPTPLWERGAKLARRNPVAATLCTFGLLGMLGLGGTWKHYSSLQQEEDRQNFRRKAALESKGLRAALEANDLLTRKRYTDAEPILTPIEEAIRDEVGFDDLRNRVGELLARCRQGRKKDAARSQDQQRLETFRRHRKEALVQETNFNGIDRPGDRDALERSARAALDVFVRPGSDQFSATGWLPESLEQPEHKEIKEGCYEAILILADLVDEPGEGLRLLDRAAELLPATQIYHLRRANLLARRGDARGALRERADAKKLQATSAIDHYLNGKELYKNKEWSAALSQFDETLQIQPEHFWAHCMSAVCSLRLSRPIQAKAELNACLQTDHASPWLYELRGLASYKVANLARQAAENLQTTGSALSGEIQSHLKAAEADFNRALELLNRSPNAELQYVLLVNRALLWIERREWPKAVADLEAAIRLDGNAWPAVESLAHVYDKQGKPDQAIELFTRAIQLKPDMAALYRARADVNLKRREPTSSQRERALRDLDLAVSHERTGNPVLALDQTNRAKLLHREGRDTEALTACKDALKSDPNFLEAYRIQIDVLRKLKRLPDVISSCDALLTRGKPSAELYELRALAKQDLSDYQGAIEDDTLAIALRPADAALRARRGGLFLITDAPRSALRDFDESIRLDPSSPDSGDAYLGRGLTRVTLGLVREALADASRAIRLGEPTHQRLYNAARIYARAAVVATADVKKTGQDAVVLVSRYQGQALVLLRQAVIRLPAAQRPTFVRDVVLTDPALATLRHRLKSMELAERTDSSLMPGTQTQN